MQCDKLFDVILDLIGREWCNDTTASWNSDLFFWSSITVPWLELIPVVASKLDTTVDYHLDGPFSFLIQSVACEQVVYFLTLIVDIRDQYELEVLQHLDLRLCEIQLPRLLGDQIMLWLVGSSRLIDRDPGLHAVCFPQVALEGLVENSQSRLVLTTHFGRCSRTH